MLLSGDIRSYRINKVTRVVSVPPDFTIGIVLPLLYSSSTDLPSTESLDNRGVPYEVDENESITVYYIVSKEFDWESNYDSILSPDTLARVVVDYLYSVGANFVAAIVPFDVSGNSAGIYANLKVPFEISKNPDDKEFLKRDIDFILVAFPEPQTVDNSDNSGSNDVEGFKSFLDAVKDHIVVCSNKLLPALDESSSGSRIGQLERYFIFGISPTRPDLMWSAYDSFKSNPDASRRVVMLTGNYPFAYLPGVLGKFGGRYVHTYSSRSYDFTWSLAGLPFVIQYLTSGDLAMPLTNKPIGGISLAGDRVGTLKMSEFYNNYGACLLISDYSQGTPTCYRSNTIAYGVNKNGGEGHLYSYPEDVEFTVMFLEDTMDKINRDYLRRFRGQKMNNSMLKTIEENFKKYVLDDYLYAKRWIVEYRNLNLYIDKNDPTILRGYYEYRPVYPINRIWIEHFFIV